MAMSGGTQRHDGVSRALHWGSAALIAAAWALGATMEELPRGAPRAAGLDLHATLGLLLVAALLARLVWRAGRPRPDPGAGLMGLAARAMHASLYAVMLVVPLSGLARVWARGRDVSVLFGSVDLAPPFAIPGGGVWGGVHTASAYLLLVLVGLHVAAALWHQFVLRDGLLLRMLPGWHRAPTRLALSRE